MINFYRFDSILNEEQQDANQILDTILKEIDAWEKQMISDLMSQVQNAPRRGILSRIGGAIQNFAYGRRNPDNPNYYRNQYGDALGVEEQFDVFTDQITNLFNETEETIEQAFLEFQGMTGSMGKKFQQTQDSQQRMNMSGTMGNQAQKTAGAQQNSQQQRQAPNLKLFNVIKAAAGNLKEKVKQIFQPLISTPPATPPATPPRRRPTGGSRRRPTSP